MINSNWYRFVQESDSLSYLKCISVTSQYNVGVHKYDDEFLVSVYSHDTLVSISSGYFLNHMPKEEEFSCDRFMVFTEEGNNKYFIIHNESGSAVITASYNEWILHGEQVTKELVNNYSLQKKKDMLKQKIERL